MYKVLLINPPTQDNKIWVREGRCQQFDIWGAPFPPLTLAYCQAQLKGIAQTRIIDCSVEKLSLAQSLEKIKIFSPDLIILSTATPTIETDLDWFLQAVKKENPAVKTVALGIHVSTLPKETLTAFSFLDFVIINEAELIVKNLINALINNQALSTVAGLAYRSGSEIIINSLQPFIENLDELPFPDWTGVNFTHYKMPIINRPFNLISFSRGCPFNCRFCASHVVNGKIIRKRSIANLIKEIETNINNGIIDYLFWTEAITTDRAYLDEFLDTLIATGLNKKIRWVCNSRVDLVDLCLFKKMKAAGCWQIAFGIESGSDEILQLMNKGGNATVAQNQKAVNQAAEAGIVVDGHFIMGYPGENEETLQKTINFACANNLTFAHFYIATPFPGSELYQQAIQKNWLSSDDWTKVNQSTTLLTTDQLSLETITKYNRQAYLKFYTQPKTIINILKIAKTPAQFLNICLLGFKLIFSLIFK